MVIRSFYEKDWQEMLALYNRYLRHDQIDERFFAQHLLLNPNFSPGSVIILEDNGKIIGWTTAMVITKNLDCWSNLAEANRNIGHIMLPATDNLDCAVKLINAAEKHLAAHGCTKIRCGLPGYTLFPNGVDENLYPTLHEAFLRSEYNISRYSHSMERSLENYSIPSEHRQKIEELAGEGIIIKTADINDILPLRKMLENSSPNWLHLVKCKVEQNKLHEMIVVRQGDEAVGCCQYNYFGMIDRIGPFRVIDSMNGKGIGTAMIAKLLEVMAQNNIKHAWFASCVKSLVYFYGKNGLQLFRQKAIFYKDL